MSHNSNGKVFILHCENANPEQHWYLWLEQQLKSEGIAAERIFLADSNHPEAEIWQTCIETQLQDLNEQSIVVAHGLSCIAVAHFLAKHLQQTQLKACLFIAAFNEPIAKFPEYDEFIKHSNFTSAVIRANVKRRLVFFSTNDPIVPVPLTFKFSNLLNAQLIEAVQAGHFRTEDGYSTFPQLLQILQTLVKAELS